MIEKQELATEDTEVISPKYNDRLNHGLTRIFFGHILIAI